MIRYFDNLKNLINDNGNFTGAIRDKEDSIQAVEALAKSLLGATLCIRGNKFVIRMLEIYYGGIGDEAHDWYRTHFKTKKSTCKEHTEVQKKEGFRVYLNSLNVDDTYTRFDIVAGNEGVPVSFLIRSVWDSNFKTNETKKGNPNIALKRMNLQPEDHDKKIGFNDSHCEIYIEDTSDEIKKSQNLRIKKQRRINLNPKLDFEDKNNVLWNFSLEKNFM